MVADLAVKLTLVLDALAISRGHVARHVGVDKSAVSRWCSGVHAPSGENVAQITRLVATRVAGFTGLDWQLEADALRRRLVAPVATGPVLFPSADAVRDATARVGQSLVGHWTEWRPSFARRDQFARDVVWIRRDGDFLAFSAVNGGLRSDGWLMPANGKATIIFQHRYSDAPGFIIVYTHEGARVEIMDGLGVTVTTLASRAIAATPLIFARHADPLDDPAADEALFTARAGEAGVFAAADVPATFLPGLDRDIGSDRVLRAFADGSLAWASGTLSPGQAADT